jgi:hypothetical protein
MAVDHCGSCQAVLGSVIRQPSKSLATRRAVKWARLQPNLCARLRELCPNDLEITKQELPIHSHVGHVSSFRHGGEAARRAGNRVDQACAAVNRLYKIRIDPGTDPKRHVRVITALNLRQSGVVAPPK